MTRRAPGPQDEPTIGGPSAADDERSQRLGASVGIDGSGAQVGSVDATAAEAFRPGQLGYHPGLDGLRAVAALVVLGFHAAIPGFENGWIGVDIFFTLSGFLITSILLKDIRVAGRPRYKIFYIRRALRLLPAYCAVVVIAVILDFFVDAGGTLKGAFVSTFYMANWAAAAGMGMGSLGHMWSLSIEEQFYIVWPAFLTALVANCARRGLSTARAITGLILTTYVLSVLLLTAGVSEPFIYNATPARSVQLLAGALLAVGFVGVRRFASQWVHALGAAGLVGLLVLLVLPSASDRTAIILGWPAIALSTCAIIASVVVGGGYVGRVLSLGPMVAIGKVSYGLYLWHYVIFTTIDAELGLDTWGPRLVGLALTAAVVPLAYVLIERPFLRRKSHVH